MGQKVHPNGIRLGITKPWNSTWFANTKDFADNLYSDFQVRQFLTKELKNASLSKITIERPAKSIRVTIHTARPGVVIGKKGEDVEKLRKQIANIAGVVVEYVAKSTGATLPVVDLATSEPPAFLVTSCVASRSTAPAGAAFA